MGIGIIVVIIVIVVIVALYQSLGSSSTAFRVVANQWIANKQMGDKTDEEIFDLLLMKRYRVSVLEDLPQRHKAIIYEVKSDIKQGFSFFDCYSLPLTLYVIFSIENNKEYINSEKYGTVEEVFEAIASVIRQQKNIAKYSEYRRVK